MDRRENEPIGFLSSMTWEFSEHDSKTRKRLKTLRRRAHDSCAGNLWVAEIDDEDLAGKPQMEIMDALLQRVARSQLFVCLLAGRRRGKDEHGSLIEFIDRHSAVSFFEAELFMAVLLEKPITVLMTDDFDPGPRLRTLIELLANSIPKTNWRKGLTPDQVVCQTRDSIDEFCKRPHSPRWLAQRRLRATRSQAVSNRYNKAMGNGKPRGSRPVLFLSGVTESRQRMPDREMIQALLDEEATLAESDLKLGRLWLAIRELMSMPPSDDSSGDFLALWNRALGRWSSVAGWYGLHGHIDLGFAAATYSMAEVREYMKQCPAIDCSSRELEYPGGGIASALYSIAKWMPTRAEKKEVLEDGMVHLHRSVEERGKINSGLAHMLGSYHFALGRRMDGLQYFKSALALTEKEQRNSGVSHSELGEAYMRTGRPLLGLAHLKTGVEQLVTHNGGHSAEYARALRKLAVGYAACGRLIAAHNTRERLREVSTKHGYLDQFR